MSLRTFVLAILACSLPAAAQGTAQSPERVKSLLEQGRDRWRAEAATATAEARSELEGRASRMAKVLSEAGDLRVQVIQVCTVVKPWM